MSPTDVGVQIYYVVGCAAIACNTFVISKILYVGYKTTPSKLLLYLQLTLLAENVCNFPNIYIKYDNFCAFIGFIRTYFGLANIIIIAMIVLHYRSLFSSDNIKIAEFLAKHRERLIFIIPVVSLLPFSTQSYGEVEDMWCSLADGDSADITWSIIIYYVWLVFFIIFDLFVMVYTTMEVLKSDIALASTLCRSVGVYVIVAVIGWIFHCLSRFHVMSFFNTNILISISSLLYFILFLLEMNSLQRYELETMGDSDQESVYLSWHVTVGTASRANTNSVRSSSISTLASFRSSTTDSNRPSSVRMQTFSKATDPNDLDSSSDTSKVSVSELHQQDSVYYMSSAQQKTNNTSQSSSVQQDTVRNALHPQKHPSQQSPV